uniref:uncharacterized protein LOC122593243 n=1 Tax=Erigeron canadensis TaxID=72917 RepID=UPI001CB8EA52|nr:uncharacterized protein LOC122593243 [Erigeron canadensis]XP_043621564.1 uncharacterized protein LOC122593243 [Erigeron canadensis]
MPPIEKPPPVIGKIGYYTVFVTPKSSPDPPPVQPPPVHYDKTPGSKFGFFWDAISTLQNVHSSLDDYLAHWFGLNQSKYQWALDDYYENESLEKADTKAKNISATTQSL